MTWREDDEEWRSSKEDPSLLTMRPHLSNLNAIQQCIVTFCCSKDIVPLLLFCNDSDSTQALIFPCRDSTIVGALIEALYPAIGSTNLVAKLDPGSISTGSGHLAPLPEILTDRSQVEHYELPSECA